MISPSATTISVSTAITTVAWAPMSSQATPVITVPRVTARNEGMRRVSALTATVKVITISGSAMRIISVLALAST